MYLQTSSLGFKLFGCLQLILSTCYAYEMLQRPIVRIEMDDAGMHRELHYTVQFDYPLAGKECEYMLEQLLPAAIYISTDQLDDLQRLNKINAKYPNFVDIEVSTERAYPFTVLLPGSPKIADTIKLPIHFRYHAPNEKTSFATVYINTPAMYLNCPDADGEFAVASDVTYCVNDKSDGFEKYVADSDTNEQSERCNWKLVHVDFQLKTPLRAHIPVGNKHSYPAVLYATIIFSWIISLWTIFRTKYVPRRINHKLNEQRILQEAFK